MRKTSVIITLVIYRGVAQLVAHTSGGRDAAGSSPVTPTIKNRTPYSGVLFFMF